MAVMYASLDDDLDRRFRNLVHRKHGLKKGNIKLCLEEALTLWVKKNS